MPEKLIIGVDGQAIQHFGVKGMRWGVRKKRGRPTNEQREQAAYRKRLATDKKFALSEINKESTRAGLIVAAIAGLASLSGGGNGWDAAKIALGAGAVAKTSSALVSAVSVDVMRYQEKKKSGG